MGWREDVTSALERLGGKAQLDEIYDAVKESRGEDLPESWQSIIRRTLEAFSSDSQVWQKGEPDLFSRVGRGQWALRSTQEVPPTIARALAEITRADLDFAIEELDKGITNNFGPSLKYDVVVGDKRYPPKAVVGLAARRFLSRPLEPGEFSGGMESTCFKVLERNGFVIEKKPEELPNELPESPPGNVWIEFSSDDNHGGDGWGFGICLWSPSRAADGKDWFTPMRLVKKGDLILHTSHGLFRGYSYAAGPYQEVAEEPPSPDKWAKLSPYYRIDLEGYHEFDTRFTIAELLLWNKEEITADSELPTRPKFYPFVIQSGKLRKFQGAYLSPCTPAVYRLIRQGINPDAKKAPKPLPASNRRVRYWAIGAGEQGRLWNNFQERGIVCLPVMLAS